MEESPEIVVLDRRIESLDLARLVRLFFGDMVKYVVDLERRIAAVGGDLHADAEQLLLESGSRQTDLWGAN
jgi:hypothetical protein